MIEIPKLYIEDKINSFEDINLNNEDYKFV
jgi:hypothetical protein